MSWAQIKGQLEVSKMNEDHDQFEALLFWIILDWAWQFSKLLAVEKASLAWIVNIEEGWRQELEGVGS